MTAQERSSREAAGEGGNPEEETRTCTECGSIETIFDPNRGEVACAQCGLVISYGLMDHGPEWRAFDQDQHAKRTRVGAPMTYTIQDRGLSTMIGWQNRDSFGKEIPAKLRAQIYRLRRWQSRIRVSDAIARNLTFALTELDRMASDLSLPKNLREGAARIYRDAVKSRLIRGRSIESVVAAALYAACRQMKLPRTLTEISGVARVGRKEIGHNYRFLSRRLNLSSQPTKPAEHISRFVAELRLSPACQRKAVEILHEAARKGLTSGRGPTGVAAAAIYVASILCKEFRTQRDVARVAQVTEVTIRNRYKELVAKLHLEISARRR